jgi:hypothetical protein
MKQPGVGHLSVLLIGALLICHGIFGALHLVCYPPQCDGGAGHPAEHEAVAGAVGDTHEHPADHGTSTGYFAVLFVGLLGLLLGVLPRDATSRLGIGMGRPPVLRREPLVLRPARAPTSPTLRVLRL